MDKTRTPWVYSESGISMAPLEVGRGDGAYAWGEHPNDPKRLTAVPTQFPKRARILRIRRAQRVADCRASADYLYAQFVAQLDEREERAARGETLTDASESESESDRKSNPSAAIPSKAKSIEGSSSKICGRITIADIPGATIVTRPRPDGRRADMTVTTSDGRKFRSLLAAKRHIDSVPFE